ncbi:MAG: esterase-like activity of phytase family protein [Pseudomonadota bacterium]
MRSLSVLIVMAAVTAALLSVGPPIGVFGPRFVGGPAAEAGEAAKEKPVRILAEPVTVPADRLVGLTPAGAWQLTADSEWFGGISGLLIEGERMLAVIDKAHLLRTAFSVAGDELGFRDATLWHLRDQNDELLGKVTGDAEGLARADGHLLISFERNHRIHRLDGTGRLQDWSTPPEFVDLENNGGIEALAGLGDGRVLAFSERPLKDGTSWWLLREGTVLAKGAAGFEPPHLATAATLGPDGRLYLLFRDYSVARGVSIRLRRLQLSDGVPVPGSIETIAAFENLSGIDNMEGIAIADCHLWIVSDDNFNASQRTLLLRFRLTE